MTDLCSFVNTRDDVTKLPFFVRGWRRGKDACYNGSANVNTRLL